MELYNLRKKYILVVKLAVFILLLTLSVSYYFPILPDFWLQDVVDKSINVITNKFNNFSSFNTLEYIAIIVVCFLIDLLVLGYDKSALGSVLRPDMTTRSDLTIFFLGLFGLWREIVLVSFLYLGHFVGNWIESNLTYNWLHSLDSVIFQILIYLVVYDFLEYWIHRVSHRTSWWWELHRFHHSATKLNIITNRRTHPLDTALNGIAVVTPLAILGLPIEHYLVIKILRSATSNLQHSMIGWNYGLLGKYLFMPPTGHRIHHSPYIEHWDKNYGHYLILWDRLFGTYYSGNFLNSKVGLSNTTDNKKGLIFDLVIGQLRFLRAFFLNKWSLNVGVLTSKEGSINQKMVAGQFTMVSDKKDRNNRSSDI